MFIPHGLALLSSLLLEPHFRAKNFFLLDSDCLPVTLFDLWQEAYLTRFPLGAEESVKCHIPYSSTNGQHDCYVRDTREGTSHGTRGSLGNGTPCRVECRICSSLPGHSAIFNWAQWNAETKNLNEGEFEARCAQTFSQVLAGSSSVNIYAAGCPLMNFPRMLARRGCKRDLHSRQFFGTVAQHSIDVIIAWALIGEWSSRVLFPPPDGQWPRHGHPQCIGEF